MTSAHDDAAAERRHGRAPLRADAAPRRVPRETSDRYFVDISRRLLLSLDRDRLLSSAAEALCAMTGLERCLIMDYDPTNGDTHSRASHGIDQPVHGFVSNAHRYDLSVRALRDVGPVVDHRPELAPFPQRAIMDELQVSGTVVAVALRSQELGAMGIAYLDSPGRYFDLTDAEADVITRLADVASLALQHSMLVDQSRALAGIRERARLAAELHDGVVQDLFAASLELDGMLARDDLDDDLRESVELAMASVRSGGARLRASLSDLAPPDANRPSGPLYEEIRDILGDLLESTSIVGELHITGEGPEPTGDQRVLVRRVVGEGLRNVAKYAEATEVSVSIRRSKAWLVVEVEDDGVGDPSIVRLAAHRGGHGFGLRSILNEASRLGGRAYIEQSRRLGGVSLSVSIPV